MRDDDEAAARPARRRGSDQRGRRDVLFVGEDEARSTPDHDDRPVFFRDARPDEEGDSRRGLEQSDARDRPIADEGYRSGWRAAERPGQRWEDDQEDHRDGRRPSGAADPQEPRRSRDRNRTHHADVDRDQKDVSVLPPPGRGSRA